MLYICIVTWDDKNNDTKKEDLEKNKHSEINVFKGYNFELLSHFQLDVSFIWLGRTTIPFVQVGAGRRGGEAGQLPGERLVPHLLVPRLLVPRGRHLPTEQSGVRDQPQGKFTSVK